MFSPFFSSRQYFSKRGCACVVLQPDVLTLIVTHENISTSFKIPSLYSIVPVLCSLTTILHIMAVSNFYYFDNPNFMNFIATSFGTYMIAMSG